MEQFPQFPQFPTDIPATVRICILGIIDSEYADRYWGLKSSLIEQTGEQVRTTLVGEVTDQSALVGIINALHNTGHTVVSVERIPSENDPPIDNMKNET